jgi:hypothetical protein
VAFKNFAAGDRTGEDDRSAVAQQRRDLLHAEEDATRVGRELSVEILNADLARRCDDDHAGIGEINIQSAEPLSHLLHNVIMMREVRHIAPDCKSVIADRCDCRIQTFLPSPGDNHLCAVVREQPCRSKPEAAVSARDQSRLAVENTQKPPFPE